MVEAVLLAGGRGTRLAPYTTVLPKPLMPVGEMPVLEILLRRLAAQEIVTVHLAVGHLAELIEAYFGDGSRWGIELRYWRESEPLGTAGPLAAIELGSERVLVMNGDLLTTLDFRALLDAHVAAGSDATIAIRRREVPVDFGVVRTDSTHVVGFEEKPVLSYDVSMGVYVFERGLLDRIPRGQRYDFPDLLERLLADGCRVGAYRSEDFWLDIGRHDDYERANQEFDALRAELLGER